MATKIGSFIRSRRQELNMTIQEVADKMPIVADTIGNIESGEIETPSIPVMKAFARVLKVSFPTLRSLLPAGAKPAESIQNFKELMDRLDKVDKHLNSIELDVGIAKRVV